MRATPRQTVDYALALMDTAGVEVEILHVGKIENLIWVNSCENYLAICEAAGQARVLFTDEWRAPRRLHVLMGTEKIEESRTDIPARRRGALDKTRYDLRAHLAVRPTSATERHLATSITCYDELAKTVRRYAWTAL